MSYTLLRNATAVLVTGGVSFLIDPALDPAGARLPVGNTANQKPNPLIGLPDGWEGMVEGVDVVVVSHTHRDHFDETALDVLDRQAPLLCQPEDYPRFMEHGFLDVHAVDPTITIDDVRITRTAGRHGTGKIGDLMAPVSGFVFQANDDPTIYVAGDTIWCDEVAESIDAYRPDVIVVNAGGARFLEGDPIVMTAEDIAQVHRAAPDALTVVVHLEAINHCHETRAYYRESLPRLGVDMRMVRIPDDGETIDW
jgi:L-ascorbate metabolism protein UlaG (beta-lactamase superfamily)